MSNISNQVLGDILNKIKDSEDIKEIISFIQKEIKKIPHGEKLFKSPPLLSDSVICNLFQNYGKQIIDYYEFHYFNNDDHNSYEHEMYATGYLLDIIAELKLLGDNIGSKGFKFLLNKFSGNIDTERVYVREEISFEDLFPILFKDIEFIQNGKETQEFKDFCEYLNEMPEVAENNFYYTLLFIEKKKNYPNILDAFFNVLVEEIINNAPNKEYEYYRDFEAYIAILEKIVFEDSFCLKKHIEKINLMLKASIYSIQKITADDTSTTSTLTRIGVKCLIDNGDITDKDQDIVNYINTAFPYLEREGGDPELQQEYENFALNLQTSDEFNL